MNSWVADVRGQTFGLAQTAFGDYMENDPGWAADSQACSTSWTSSDPCKIFIWLARKTGLDFCKTVPEVLGFTAGEDR
jgi:hypothetical protein